MLKGTCSLYRTGLKRLQVPCNFGKQSLLGILNNFVKKNMSSQMENAQTDENSDVLVVVDKIGKITTIGINRPEVRNSVNTPTALLLEKAIGAFEKDDESPVAVLYGKGGNFCSGFDLKELSSMESVTDMKRPEGLGPMGPSRRFISKPVIAAVSGYAVAGGLELALMCDMRVVEETAVMGVFCRRFGVPLIDGGTVRLPALIGLSRAMDLILTGRGIKADEALEWGLANRVVGCGTSLGQAVNLANSIAKFPQACLLTDRRSAYYSSFNAKSLEDALAFEECNGAPVIDKESIAGASKFMAGTGRHGKFNLNTESKL